MLRKGYYIMNMASKTLSQVRNEYCGKKLRALVVDNVMVCKMVCEAVLKYIGLETRSVDSGTDAIELLASDVTFHLIVVDRYLLIMNGIEVTRKFREMGVNGKIVATSVDGNDREDVLAADIDEFIQKPITHEDLAPILERIAREI